MRNILSLLVILAGILKGGAAYAAVTIVPVPPVPPVLPVPPQVRIFIPDSSLKPIELRKLEINGEVAGSISHATIDMTFYNPNSRVLEGELQFPLLSNQTVTAFSLEMEDGKMRDAVPVEKSRGREVFEEIVRRGIDPALLELTSGNNFKLRVYPLTPGKTRRVRVVITELLQEGKDSVLFSLPIEYGQKIDELDLSLKIAHKGKPSVKSSPFDKLDIESKDGNWVCHVNAKNHSSNGTLALEIPLWNKDDDIKTYTGRKDGKNYFYAEIPIAENIKWSAPSKIDILWDASASGKNRNLAAELSFLEAFFTKVSNVSASLVIVRNIAEPALNFEISNGNWKELKSALESVIYDGATNLGALAGVADGADIKLLFSDGLDNFSTTKFSPGATPLFAIVSSAGADANSLRRHAEKSGGTLIDLTVCDPVTALLYMNYRAEGLSFDGNATDVVWNISGKVLKMSGVIKDKGTPFAVTINNVRSVLDFDNNEYTFVPSMWATMKVSDLEAEYDINKAEIRRIGKAFNLVTRGTSLIVLERAEDYVQYDIEPPAELKKEYDRLRISSRINPNQNKEKNKIERVVREWKDREAWWDKDFSKGPIPISKKVPPQQDMLLAPGARRESAGSAANQLLYESAVPGRDRESDNMMLNDAAMPLAAPAPAGSASESEEAPDERGSTSVISIRKWTSDAAYISRMKDAGTEQIYRIYLDERPDYESSPAFYLDVASYLEEKGLKELALRVLSNLAEMNLENRQILRVLGYRLMQTGHPEFAVVIFKKVLEIGEEEPQSYRDLGLAYEAVGEYQKAVDYLYNVVEKSFSRNFPGIEVIALTEMNMVIALAPDSINTSHIDPRLLKNMPVELRVILVWDSDLTDIDLHVTDPNGEEAFYSYPLTFQGGRVSPDNTTGYGPEEYSLKIAKPGKYTVHVNFYGHTQQAISESTTIQLDFFTNYGTKDQRKQSVTMRLKERKDRIFVGEFEVENRD